MKRLILALFLLSTACTSSAATSQNPDLPRWQQRAANVSITRDDWGIAHVRGKTDADAVFGMIYAQAEDDFNRVETNYLNSMGRLAEAEGESAIYRDLRMKIFIDPVDMQAQYAKAPDWLKALMNAWADGLNFYLSTHPNAKPRVITKFEPWMALTFSEGSIGGDIERVNLRTLERFYSGSSGSAVPQVPVPRVRNLMNQRNLRNLNPPARTASPSPPPTPRQRNPCSGSIRTRPSSSVPNYRWRATRD